MGSAKAISLYTETIKHLKIRQVYYQLFYRLKRKFVAPYPTKKTETPAVYPLSLDLSIPSANSYRDGQFEFLNKSKTFSDKINWDFSDFGKLWAYNLNYFDFLNQPGLNVETGTKLVSDFCSDLDQHKEASEPYTISLRGINWIKFFTYNKITNSEFNEKLFIQYQRLSSNLEFHLLGNHLLENGFSLLFGAYYFRNDVFYKKALRILRSELNEQILSDGGHFELSPMYHQIILFRLIDALNLVTHNPWKDDGLNDLLNRKAIAMIGWLKAITFKNGDIPMVNDSASGIAPSSRELIVYASRLSISSGPSKLSDSGYELIRLEELELFVDIGRIGPDYIPGHAHSDTLNFILYLNGQPVIVDTGTSTYDAGPRRHVERSTMSHNTVKIEGQEQSEIWGSFRVGRRAKILALKKNGNQISACHDGYNSLGARHCRTWTYRENELQIIDRIEGTRKTRNAALFHFHPSVEVKVEGMGVVAGQLTIKFDGAQSIVLGEYEFAHGFNQTRTGQLLTIDFMNSLESNFRW